MTGWWKQDHVWFLNDHSGYIMGTGVWKLLELCRGGMMA